MKTHQEISSSRRKCRKAHFTAPSNVRYRLMRSTLSKNLRKQHNVRSMPVKKNDEVIVVKGNFKGTKGKVTQVYRKRWCIHIEKLSKTKANGAPVQIPIRPSQCALTKMNLEQDRKDLIKRKAFTLDKKKGKADKYTSKQID